MSKASASPPPPGGQFILYQTEDGRTRVQCRFDDEALWLTQAQIADLFQTTPQNVTLHLKAIFAEGELVEAATCKDYLQVRSEGGCTAAARGCGLREGSEGIEEVVSPQKTQGTETMSLNESIVENVAWTRFEELGHIICHCPHLAPRRSAAVIAELEGLA